MGYIFKLDTHSGLRNSLASSCPSLKTLLAFSSPQNISHLMSCLTLHASLHAPFQSLFCFGLFPLSHTLLPTLCTTLILIQIAVYTCKTYGRSVCSIAFFTFPLQIPMLIDSAPVYICSESLLSDILSLSWVCVCYCVVDALSLPSLTGHFHPDILTTLCLFELIKA